ncbi:MAG: DeoR/GlpR family DNA-binding transcription regulator [Butyrivibrio sp.]|nr:DeoR/GlpR family DNA-binding transcription regulator [Butyrivibrio sp.]
MLTEERRKQIVSIVNEKKAVTVAELTELLDSSEATIRRDLNALSKASLINKVFGGATSLDSSNIKTTEESMQEKARINIEEKDSISKYAATLINDQDFVFIDSGTTTLKLIDYITNTNAKYITNGIRHAKKLIDKGCETSILGGRIKTPTEAIIGPDCVESISKYHFTKAFMGTNGIAIDAGCTTPDVDEALVKSVAIKQAYITYILADHTKFGQVNAVTFADISKCCIITDKEPAKRYLEKSIVKVVSNNF